MLSSSLIRYYFLGSRRGQTRSYLALWRKGSIDLSFVREELTGR
jgi:hypothetical protein